MPDYKITEAFLKDLHSHVCGDIKADLEKHYPEVFEAKESVMEAGMVFTFKVTNSSTGPRIVVKDGDRFLFINPEGYVGHETKNSSMPSKDFYAPMRSGKITISVKDGKVAGATVQED